jgi:hypothetical protein
MLPGLAVRDETHERGKVVNRDHDECRNPDEVTVFD